MRATEPSKKASPSAALPASETLPEDPFPDDEDAGILAAAGYNYFENV